MLKFFGGKKSTASEETQKPAEEPEIPEAKASLFARMKQAVSRTRDSLSERIEGLVALTRTVDESAIEQLEAALLASDLGLPTTTDLLDAVRDRARREDVDGTGLRSILRQELVKILSAPVKTSLEQIIPPASNTTDSSHTQVIFLVGVNGTGKTTTSGKMAAWFRAEGSTVLLCAADTFRAAAIEQLEVWAKRSGVELIKTQQGADPAAVLYDAASAAKARKIDLLLVDTAGRLHTKSGLMSELEKMRRTAAKLIPGAPHEVLLVMDATTGQNGLQQARQFTDSAGVTGIVLTKLDGTAKGGIAVAIAREMNLPVRFAGVGEKIDDLLEFNAEAFVDSLLA